MGIFTSFTLAKQSTGQQLPRDRTEIEGRRREKERGRLERESLVGKMGGLGLESIEDAVSSTSKAGSSKLGALILLTMASSRSKRRYYFPSIPILNDPAAEAVFGLSPEPARAAR
ncbi:hypothetical protein CRG98_006686 [Punica granatum]|uniref:Uncharacterized protein n=1 Tax=Punica granatum TaxID=22663 RepID=A0A2I0KYR9_PUNGR|nr:hypothetical protein CRG98_006686 [Punica granatum]